ncbi:MAG: M1 family aminopeptidase [Candidatus Zixiibacteriota bacterium]
MAFRICLSQATPREGFDLYEKLKDLNLDELKIAGVKDLSIKKDVAQFNLTDGQIYIFEPVQDKITGMVFIGEGVFEFTPPTEIEKYQLKRFTGAETLNKSFNELYLRFTDDTAEKLMSEIEFASGEVPGKAKRIKDSSEDRIKDLLKMNINTRILADLRADSFDGFFYAEINPEDSPRMFFLYDPKEVEEVNLIQEATKGAFQKCDLVCSFHKEKDYEERLLNDEDKDEIKVNHYDMDIEIDRKWNLNAEVGLEIEALQSGFRVLNFDLSEDLEVSAVLNEAGDSLDYIREKDMYEATVILPDPLQKGETRRLKFIYSGDILNRNYYGDFYIKSATYWYPRYGYWTRSTFDLNFKTPKDFEFVTIGKRDKKKKEKDYIITHWKEEFPVPVASFNLGIFDIYELDYSGIPEVEVYYVEESHRKITQDYQRLISKYGSGSDILLQDAHMKENIGADVVNSMNFFQENFGKCPFKKISATEIPGSHGQGFPGLLHLSWGSFQREKKFEYESFRAHEVSHQWWGHIVGWKTYHDQWLSEGFAEYSGLWFAQMSLKDNERFFGTLRRWKEEIIEGGYVGYGLDKLGEAKTLWGDGTKAGPLWLGQRLSSSKSEDYFNLVYQKGAYVLHMIRNMMMDFKDYRDDKFIKMMKDFVKTYYGKNASTEDFKRMVEKHTGEDMTWFFDQWVYGTEIPKYIYSYSIDKVDDKFQITVEVKQENVSQNFKMPVPVVVVFKDDSYSIFRIMVDKPANEIKLPLVDKEIKEIVFNPFHSVLCEVEEK